MDVDTETLPVEGDPSLLPGLILMRIRCCGSASYPQFKNELEEFCPGDIQQALDELEKTGLLRSGNCFCGTIYRANTCLALR